MTLTKKKIAAALVIGAVGIGALSSGHGNGHKAAAAQAPAATSPATSAPVTKTTPKPKPTMTVAQQQALASAKNYLSLGTGFSRAGLIQQLSSQAGDGFPKAVATWAVDHINVNWNKQAVVSAKNYLSLGTGFSRSSLIQQLDSKAGDGFTHSQAVYAANAVGL